MKPILFFLLAAFPCFAFAQEQDATIPKDAPIDVTVSDFKNNMLPYEIIVFRSALKERDYQGITGTDGKFTIRLPAGDKYEIFILGFKDSTSYNVLEIPAPSGNTYYKDAFRVDIQFESPRTFVLEDCNFETGKATLEPESYKVLDELVAYLNRKVDERIELGGHTDNVGSAAANLKLSQERAQSVKNYLVARGISEDRVEARGYGMTEPVAENTTEEGRAQNRRTEVKIL